METAKAPANLVEKLAAVMAQVERVPKNGENKFHGYKYATEADITDAVRSNMARFGVMLIPSVDKIDWREVETKSGKERIASLTVRFTATDGTDKIEFVVIGEGQDRGDKATYKAMTGATKYALLKLFLIPTGDDPETEGDEEPHRGSNTAPRPQRNGRTAPSSHEARKVDLKTRMMKAGVQGANIPEKLGEWIGRAVDGSTVISVDDWMKADAGIEQITQAADALARAHTNGATA